MGVNLSRLFLAKSGHYELATTVRDVCIAQDPFDISTGRKCFTLGRDSFMLQGMYKRFTVVICSELSLV